MTPQKDTWINKEKGIWNYGSANMHDVQTAYLSGNFNKVKDYLAQHQDLVQYLNKKYKDINQFPVQAEKPTLVEKPVTPVTTPVQSQQQAPVQQKLGMFTNDDIRNLGFRNYSGMLSAVRNQANSNNPFVKAMIGRYGSNFDKWDQSKIEGDLGVRGTYRSFGSGDFGDISRSMASWIGQNNGTIDKRELQNRTGKDGVVYSNATTKNLFDKQTLKKPWEQDLKLQLTPITSINQFKQGGIMYKYQQGGSNDPMDQIAQLSAAFLQGDTKSGQQLVEILNNKEIGPQLIKAVQQGIKQQDQRATIIAQAIQTLTQGNTRKARLGAKLNYIRQSIGECPEGEEVIYFKKGGEICKMCSSKKLQKGGKSDPVKDFKKKKEQDAVKKSYELNPYTRGKSAKEIAEMQKRNNQEASRGEGESPADIAPWRKKNIKKHQQGGWIDKDKKIWNWDSMDRFNRVKNWYQGKSNELSDEDWEYVHANPELESALHNIYKVSKLPNKRTVITINTAQYVNNMPKGADPNARVDVVPDSTNNFKGYIGVGQFKMLKKPKQQTPKQKPKQQTSFAKKENAVRRNHFNNWTAFVKKYYPSVLGSFKKTMENAGYTYDWNTGIYRKSGSAYRLNNGQLQTQNIYTGNWNNISNIDSLPGMPAVTMAIRSQR